MMTEILRESLHVVRYGSFSLLADPRVVLEIPALPSTATEKKVFEFLTRSCLSSSTKMATWSTYVNSFPAAQSKAQNSRPWL